jgi:sigma-B regulation protein RsbU (phosphoserine phosphatase)
MSGPQVDAWSSTLHRLWAAAMTATDRLDLGSRVLTVLLGLPGAVAVAGVDQDAKGRTESVRWSAAGKQRLLWGGGLAADLERLVSRPHDPVLLLAEVDLGTLGHLGVAIREAGGRTVAVAGFAGSSGAVTSLCVVFGGAAVAEPLAVYFAQVAEVGRQALDRLARESLLEDEQSRDALLAEASLQMDAVLDVAQTAQRVARMAVPAVAEGCLVYLAAGDAVTLAVGVHVDARRRWPGEVTGPQLGQLHDLVARTMTAPPGPAGDVQELSPAAASALGARLLAITVLRARGRLLGAVVFLFDRSGDRLPDPAFLSDLTRRAALAIDNAELYEQRRRDVMTLQMHLLPATLQVVRGVQAAAMYAVADETFEVGGDFYDVVPQSDGGGAALIGDVCGRGVGAAALTGMARHTLSTLLHERMSGERALSRLNTVLRHDGSWRFVTGAVATFRPEPGGGLAVRLASAGHPAPLVVRASGEVVSARGGGVVLGVREQARIGTSRLRLAPGDTLLMFTDGLTEARDADGVMFEDAALRRSLEGMQAVPVGVLVEELGRLAAGFSRNGADDIAVLGLRPTGAGSDDE